MEDKTSFPDKLEYFRDRRDEIKGLTEYRRKLYFNLEQGGEASTQDSYILENCSFLENQLQKSDQILAEKFRELGSEWDSFELRAEQFKKDVNNLENSDEQKIRKIYGLKASESMKDLKYELNAVRNQFKALEDHVDRHCNYIEDYSSETSDAVEDSFDFIDTPDYPKPRVESLLMDSSETIVDEVNDKLENAEEYIHRIQVLTDLHPDTDYQTNFETIDLVLPEDQRNKILRDGIDHLLDDLEPETRTIDRNLGRLKDILESYEHPEDEVDFTNYRNFLDELKDIREQVKEIHCSTPWQTVEYREKDLQLALETGKNFAEQLENQPEENSA